MAEEKIKEHKIVVTLRPGDFRASMGRAPCSQEEFDRWAQLAEKWLLNGPSDWQVLYECAAKSMRGQDSDEE